MDLLNDMYDHPSLGKVGRLWRPLSIEGSTLGQGGNLFNVMQLMCWPPNIGQGGWVVAGVSCRTHQASFIRH